MIRKFSLNPDTHTHTHTHTHNIIEAEGQEIITSLSGT